MDNQDFLKYLDDKAKRQEIINDMCENNQNNNPFSDVLLIVLLYKNDDFKVRAPYDIEILGKKMWEWVALSCDGAKTKTTPCTKDSNIIELVKPFVSDQKYTVILYSDTPLLNRSHILEILDYFKSRDLNVLKLSRGFVFNTEYLKNCENVLVNTNKMFDGEEFLQVDSFEKVSKVQKKLQEQIILYHMKNGVHFTDEKSVYIDAGVGIEKNVTVEANNTIKGNSYICEGCIIESNNIIKDSIISKNCVIKCSYISGSAISENSIIGPFDKIIDQNI